MPVVSRTSGLWARLVLHLRPPRKPVGRWAVGDGAGNAFRRADQGSWDNGFLLVVTNGVSPGYKANEMRLFNTKENNS